MERGIGIMLSVLAIFVSLLLGFIFGRIWQIRQQMQKSMYVSRLKIPAEINMPPHHFELPELPGGKPSAGIKDQASGAARVSRLRGRPEGRFQSLHQALHHAGGASL
jgi:hypothetical protein